METIRFMPLTENEVGPDAYIDFGTSILESENLNEISIYPVPTNNILHLDLQDFNIDRIEILDLSGKSLISNENDKTSENLTIDTSDLMNGLYIVRFLDNGILRSSEKILIQH